MDGISCFAIIIVDHITIIRAIYSIQYPVSVPLRNQKLILLHYNLFPIWICLSCYFVMIFLFDGFWVIVVAVSSYSESPGKEIFCGDAPNTIRGLGDIDMQWHEMILLVH